jgi:polysaccharide pyruvyl transferase WcaK-like protein
VWAETNGLIQLREATALIIPGTGILDDFNEVPRGLPLSLFKWCLFAKLLGVKVLFVSVGAGPILHPLSRSLMKRAAWLADYRTYRDKFSQAFMRNLGLGGSKDTVYPDLVFALDAGNDDQPEQRDDRPVVVGVGLMAYFGWRLEGGGSDAIFNTYLEKMADFILWLLDRGFGVRILIGELSDRLAVSKVLERISTIRPNLPSRQIVTESIATLQDVLREVAQTDLVVCTRFHNLVCALLCDKPAISLGYSEKNDVLMEEMGLGRYCQHIEHFTPEKLHSHFEEVRERSRELHERIRTQRLRYRALLSEQFEHLRGLLNRPY